MDTLETSELMTIGRFARITGLTVKALRHYDEVGLLRPAAVDPETGYRSYSSGQVRSAERIRMLRRLELPLDDIATLVETEDPALIHRVLVDHQRRTAIRSAQLKIVLQGLQPLIDGKESVMSTPVEAIDHRRLGVDLFNKTWTLMEKDDRTEAEDDELLHCAHASAYHWLQVGTPANRARSEWQCSRMYTVLGRAEPALHHARRCLEICESNPEALEDWDVPFAHEALARAHGLAGDQAEARRHEERARELGERIEGDEDRRLLEADLATLARSRGEQLLERRRVVERPDQGEVEPARADHVLRDALHVVGGDRVEAGGDLLGLDRLALEHLAAEPEHRHPLRVLEPEHEASLGERARLLELVRRARSRRRSAGTPARSSRPPRRRG